MEGCEPCKSLLYSNASHGEVGSQESRPVAFGCTATVRGRFRFANQSSIALPMRGNQGDRPWPMAPRSSGPPTSAQHKPVNPSIKPLAIFIVPNKDHQYDS
jgi:hypothetical protein